MKVSVMQLYILVSINLL